MLHMIKGDCINCKHFKTMKEFTQGELEIIQSDFPHCDAFPDGIPEKYLNGDERHDKVDPNQKGKSIFEKKRNAQPIQP